MTMKELIRQLMKEQGLELSDLARRIGITRFSMWDRLNPKKKSNMTVETLKGIMDWFGFDIILREREGEHREYTVGKEISMPKNAYDFHLRFCELEELLQKKEISKEEYEARHNALEEEYLQVIKPKFDND